MDPIKASFIAYVRSPTYSTQTCICWSSFGILESECSIKPSSLQVYRKGAKPDPEKSQAPGRLSALSPSDAVRQRCLQKGEGNCKKNRAPLSQRLSHVVPTSSSMGLETKALSMLSCIDCYLK